MTSLNPLFTVESQLSETLRAHLRHRATRPRASRALELLKSVGIPEPERRLKAYPHQLSGGQRQRVVIAAALSLRSEACCRRRAHDGARRVRPGADPEAHPRPRRRARYRRSARDPQHGRGGADRRPGHASCIAARSSKAARWPTSCAARRHAYAQSSDRRRAAASTSGSIASRFVWRRGQGAARPPMPVRRSRGKAAAPARLSTAQTFCQWRTCCVDYVIERLAARLERAKLPRRGRRQLRRPQRRNLRPRR